MTHNIKEINEKIQELLLTNPNIVTIGYGYKISNNQVTEDLSIIFSVKQKKEISELASEEIIPTEIELSNSVLKTDVVVMNEVSTLACNANCGQIAGPSSIDNRAFTRPLKGGLSITSKNNVTTVGTLGFIGVHSETQALVGVTNNHVTISDAFYTSDRDLFGIVKNEYNPVNYIYQNGESGVIPTNPAYTIGQSLRYVPIHEQGKGINYVDGAIFSVKEEDIDKIISLTQVGETYSNPLPFATTEEIDNLLISNPMLYSSGRTTGPKGGTLCPMRVAQLGVNTNIEYKKQNVPTVVTFSDCILFVKPENDPNIATICSNPIYSGDSGSALIADFDGERKIIGLVFASVSVGGVVYYGLANRIDRVMTELGIEAWDGTNKNFIDPTTIEYKTTYNGSNNKTLTCGPKTYWQVGLTLSENNC